MLATSPPRVMLLTSSLGAGHVSASRAVAAALHAACDSIRIETVDFWTLMDPDVAEAIRQAYLDTISGEPELYDAVYRLDEQTWQSLFDTSLAVPKPLETFIDHFSARIALGNGAAPDTPAGPPHPSDRLLLRHLCASLVGRQRYAAPFHAVLRPALVRWIWARLSRRLEQQVTAFRPDVAIATQMAPVALLAAIKNRRGLGLPLIAVPTDFGIHEFWLRHGIGWFCVAHESLTRPDLPAGSVIRATGIPLMPAFRDPPERGAARAALGLDPVRPLVLVAGGGLALGVDAISERILADVPDAAVAAVSGHNPGARDTLASLAARYPGRLVDCGWTDCMPTWLRAADVVVGKPGGLTVAESLACGRFLLALRSPGGQEGFNVRFLVEHGAGDLVRDEELGGRVRALLADPARLRSLEAQAAAVGRRDGAAQIAALALDAVNASRGDQAPAGVRA
jgi:processive 1,2-diacylglycerol beta-glucosyltransferase